MTAPASSYGGTDVVLRRVPTGNAFEETVERLLQVIKLGLVRQGERLPVERELARRLGVSRVTLREAIRALQQAGYVESRRGRYGGTFVVYRPQVGKRGQLQRIARRMGAELRDALTFREVVEPGAAAAAARAGLDEAGRAHVGQRLAEVRDASLDTYRQADSRLHLAIAELAGSPSLLAAVADVRARLNDLLDAIPLLERNLVHSNDQHEEVVAAIVAGDEDEAARAMRDHLAGTAALLRAFLA